MPIPTAPQRPRGQLIDPQGRLIEYLRFSATDRCNLRCRYCMPKNGVDLLPRDKMIAFEDAFRLCDLLCRNGIRKIRITGGEPLVRKGTIEFMRRLSTLPSQPEILLTTNGLLIEERLPELMAAGVRRINLSLDSLDPETWAGITRRQGLERVMSGIDAILEAGLGLKINMVVMAGVNDHEIIDFVNLTRENPLDVRFIEAMRFDGTGRRPAGHVSGPEIIDRLLSRYSLVEMEGAVTGVARLFSIPEHRGKVGVIEGHTRSFCGSCNRLRLDARGRLRTCLYGPPLVSLGEMIRRGADDIELLRTVEHAVGKRLEDGALVERFAGGNNKSSMASIGG